VVVKLKFGSDCRVIEIELPFKFVSAPVITYKTDEHVLFKEFQVFVIFIFPPELKLAYQISASPEELKLASLFFTQVNEGLEIKELFNKELSFATVANNNDFAGKFVKLNIVFEFVLVLA
jgi:hypothetical protein